MQLKGLDFTIPGGTPLGKLVKTVKGFPVDGLVGLWLPSEEEFTVGQSVSSLTDFSGNEHTVALHTTSLVPVATATGLQSPSSGVGFFFDTNIPWGTAFTFVTAVRITQTPASGTYPGLHQSTTAFQAAGMSASNPQTGVTLNVDNQAVRTDVRPAMFANSSPANFGGTPRQGATLAAAGQDAWFIAAWSYDPDTDTFTFRGKASGAILGKTITHAATGAYLEAFGGYHSFGLCRFQANAVQGEFHGAMIYDVAKDADDIDDLITRMAEHMNAVGIDTV